MKSGFIIICTLLVMIFSQCSAKHNEEQPQAQIKSYVQDEFQKGIVLKRVQTHSDTTETFALYLPTYYTTQKKFPVIYFFDPRARGKKPVELLKDYAEKYGYILIGSNNSKNGISWDKIKNSITILFADTYNRISIDERRVYTAGFSGGARVACSIAIELGGIEGVTACSAGPSQNLSGIKNPFSFIGFVGDEDFNYLEMKNVDRSMDETTIPHHLEVFKGRHDWSPRTVLEEAFLWFEFNAMKRHLIQKNETLINSFADSISSLISEKQRTVQPLESYYFLYQKYINYLDGLKNISEYKTLYNELMASQDMQTSIKKEFEWEQKETQFRNSLIESFGTKDKKWWETELASLFKLSHSKDKYESAVNTRLIRFLSLASFMNANNAFNSNNIKMAELFIYIYNKVDPDNPDLDFLQAKLFAAKGVTNKALNSIERGIKRGFDDKDKLMNDSFFNSLKSNDRFIKLVNLIED